MNRRRSCFLETFFSSDVSDIWRGEDEHLVERLRLGANADAVPAAARRREADVNFIVKYACRFY